MPRCFMLNNDKTVVVKAALNNNADALPANPTSTTAFDDEGYEDEPAALLIDMADESDVVVTDPEVDDEKIYVDDDDYEDGEEVVDITRAPSDDSCCESNYSAEEESVVNDSIDQTKRHANTTADRSDIRKFVLPDRRNVFVGGRCLDVNNNSIADTLSSNSGIMSPSSSLNSSTSAEASPPSINGSPNFWSSSTAAAAAALAAYSAYSNYNSMLLSNVLTRMRQIEQMNAYGPSETSTGPTPWSASGSNQAAPTTNGQAMDLSVASAAKHHEHQIDSVRRQELMETAQAILDLSRNARVSSATPASGSASYSSSSLPSTIKKENLTPTPDYSVGGNGGPSKRKRAADVANVLDNFRCTTTSYTYETFFASDGRSKKRKEMPCDNVRQICSPDSSVGDGLVAQRDSFKVRSVVDAVYPKLLTKQEPIFPVPAAEPKQHISSRQQQQQQPTAPGQKQRYTCSECGKHYATSSNLSRHKQTHRSLDSPSAKKCPVCCKAYVSMPALSMHILTHNLCHKCPICDKAFSRPWLLQGHMRSHSGDKPYGCAHCGKSFADRSNLRAHMQTHSHMKNHECGQCGKSFALKSYLNKHLESNCVSNDGKIDISASSDHSLNDFGENFNEQEDSTRQNFTTLSSSGPGVNAKNFCIDFLSGHSKPYTTAASVVGQQ